MTCDERCQQPTPGTCTGTTPDACEDLAPGEQTCGLGECRRTVAQCQAGRPVECVAGAPSVESCNGLDDDCDGELDDTPCNGCPAGTVVPAGWVCVPAGTYTLGSPLTEYGHQAHETLHEVELTRPYLLRTTEATQAEWQEVIGWNPSWFKSGVLSPATETIGTTETTETTETIEAAPPS